MRAAARRRPAAASIIIGVDVGSTTTAVGLVAPSGNVIADASAPTLSDGRDPLETIVALIAQVTERAGRTARAFAAVGVGVPGPVDAVRGIVGQPVTRIMIVPGDKRASVRGAAALAHEQAGRADTKKPRRRR